MILLTIQFAVLAGYAVILVAGMLVERRRSEIALMRSRGASGGHLIAMAVLEAAFLAIPAAVLPRCLAFGVIGAARDVRADGRARARRLRVDRPDAIVISALAGLACIVALTLPTLFVSAQPGRRPGGAGRQARTTLAAAARARPRPGRRRRGRPLAAPPVRGAADPERPRLAGLDPLLVAAPAIGLVAGAVLALRIVPRLAELGERVLVARPRPRRLARRAAARPPAAPLHAGRAPADARGGARDARRRARRDVDPVAGRPGRRTRRPPTSGSSPPTTRRFRHGRPGPLYRSIPGVRQATPLILAPFDLGRTVRDGPLRRARARGPSPRS